LKQNESHTYDIKFYGGDNLEQIALVEEKVKPDTKRFTATITLTNSKKVGFSRRDLALCFYPQKVVEKADRTYTTVMLDGRPIPMSDNPKLVKRLWEIIQHRYIHDGTVRKASRTSFDWAKIVKRLLRDYNLERFYAYPERHKTITGIKITTNTPIYDEHAGIIEKLYLRIRKNAPHLSPKPNCSWNVEGTCPVPFSEERK